MKAEIISVGTELLLGHTINTDAAHVARELSALGIDLLFSCTVGDNPARLREALQTAFARSDLVITTGGLGPTGDDLTKETVAEVAGVELVRDPASVARIEDYFRGRECGPSQYKQADLPRGCTVLQNDVGTAPGCVFESGQGALVLMLPGPPSELLPMLRHYAAPFLAARTGGVIASRMVRVFGVGEGSAAEQLADLLESANPTAATYAKENEMFIRVTAKAETSAAALALCEPMVAEICRRLDEAVYIVNEDGTSDSCLEQVVVQALGARGMTLATAESCTGGLLAKRITDVPGSSEVFHMSAVTYANEVKTKLLGVPAELFDTVGAVSPEVARAMAEGVRQAACAGLGVGITGIAGPGGGSAEKPVGLVYVALSDGKAVWVRRMNPTGRIRSRTALRDRAASVALDMVRRRLGGLTQPEAEAFVLV